VKRVLIIADLHCGHRAGLTCPDRQYRESSDEDLEKYGEVQRKMWNWYVNTVESIGPVDTLVVNGDALDGKSDKSGGTELITSDRRIQVKMSVDAIRVVPAKRIYIVKGTQYHVGKEEDWEEILADSVGAAHCGFHEWIDADGVIIDFKHKVTSSGIPHGRNTAPNRAALWNLLWAERKMQPLADIIIRSHVHYYVGSETATKLVMTTPCLQGWTKFGSREIEGTNDVGMTLIECEKGKWDCHKHFMDMTFAAAEALPA
jgi:hypothetical protein